MQDCAHLVVEIVAIADVAVAGAAVRAWALRGGLRGRVAAELATCASELASNVVRHGGGGRLEVIADGSRVFIRACDRGVGEAAAIRDRIAGARAVGVGIEHGLATVLRWMDVVDVHERKGGGIEVVASREALR